LWLPVGVLRAGIEYRFDGYSASIRRSLRIWVGERQAWKRLTKRRKQAREGSRPGPPGKKRTDAGCAECKADFRGSRRGRVIDKQFHYSANIDNVGGHELPESVYLLQVSRRNYLDGLFRSCLYCLFLRAEAALLLDFFFAFDFFAMID
jgi:hypothetical protein